MTLFGIVVLHLSANQDPRHPVEENLIITNEWEVWFKLLQENDATGRKRMQLSRAALTCLYFIPSHSCSLQSLCTFQLLKQIKCKQPLFNTINENKVLWKTQSAVRKTVLQVRNNRGKTRVMEIPFLLAFHSLVSTGIYSLINILWSYLITCITI